MDQSFQEQMLVFLELELSNLRYFLFFSLLFICFFSLKSFFSFPLIADDYRYAAAALDLSLSLSTFARYMSRIPFWCLGSFSIFSFDFLKFEHFVYAVFFILNSFYLLATVKLLQKKLQLKISLSFILPLVFAYSFFPNDHEIIYWPTTWAYMGGYFFVLAAAFLNRKWAFLKILCFTVAFLFGEMHVFTALALELADKQHFSKKEFFTRFFPWFCSLVLLFFIRLALSFFWGKFQHQLIFHHFDPLGQILRAMKHYSVLSFYKDYWPITLFYWSGLFLGCQKPSKNQIIFFLRTIFISSSIVFLMGYFATRAMYGASFVFNALMILWLAKSYGVWFENRQKVRVFLSFAIIFISLAGFTIFIFDLKDQNTAILKKKEQAMIAYWKTCDFKCDLSEETKKSLSQGLVRGWVLAEDYHEDFINWVRLKATLQ